jgi:tetratricopeptide (TPR) repeat protein
MIQPRIPRGRRSQTGAILVAAIVLGVMLPRFAVAAADRQARGRAAHKACLNGNYEEGVSLLSDLFLDTHDPTYLYNQGRCLEQNRRFEDAIARFTEYLHSAQSTRLTDADRAEAEKHIAVCKAALEFRAAHEPATAPPAASVGAPATAQPPTGTSQATSSPTNSPVASLAAAQPQTGAPAGTLTAAPETAPAARSGRALRIAGIACGAVGVAAIGAGVGFALKTRSISSDEAKNGPTKAQEDDRKKYETLGWISYGVGAAALATGAVLYLLGWPSDPSTTVALLPSANAAGATVILGRSF